MKKVKIRRKKKREVKLGLVVFLALFGLILFILALGVKLSMTGVIKNENNHTENITPIFLEDCENLSLVNFTTCITNFIKPHYNYTLRNLVESYENEEKYGKGYYIITTNLAKNKTAFQDILENGGDCTEWAYVYRTLAVAFNYTYTNVHVPGHVYIVLADETGYCSIDGKKAICRGYQ